MDAKVIQLKPDYKKRNSKVQIKDNPLATLAAISIIAGCTALASGKLFFKSLSRYV